MSLDPNHSEPNDPLPDLESCFTLICRNLNRIKKNPKMFWSIPPRSRAAFSFGGGFDVPIGIWSLAWEKGIGVYKCEHCGGKVFLIFTNGAMSMGWSMGYCSVCGKKWSGRKWSVGTWAFLRTKITELKDGLAPAFQPYIFQELLDILKRSR